MAKKTSPVLPNGREAAILALLVPRELYGLQIMQEYQKATDEALPLGAVYTTLDRMVGKGYLRSRRGEDTHDRGGNRRRYFEITGAGQGALRVFERRASTIRQVLGLGATIVATPKGRQA